jgi:hypothetical protein
MQIDLKNTTLDQAKLILAKWRAHEVDLTVEQLQDLRRLAGETGDLIYGVNPQTGNTTVTEAIPAPEVKQTSALPEEPTPAKSYTERAARLVIGVLAGHPVTLADAVNHPSIWRNARLNNDGLALVEFQNEMIYAKDSEGTGRRMPTIVEHVDQGPHDTREGDAITKSVNDLVAADKASPLFSGLVSK